MTVDELCGIQQKLSIAWDRSELLTQFVEIFISLSEADRLRACYELDSNLVFSSGGSVDLSYIASSLESRSPDIFAQFKYFLPSASSVYDASHPCWRLSDQKLCKTPFFALLTDVDDTLLPSSDAFGMGGCDTSWRRNGTLYPGMSALHRILRGDDFPNNQPGSRGYSVCLTARPAALVKSLAHKCQRLGPRLSILPGNVADNVCRKKEFRYDNYAKSKIEQFNRYIRWFRGEDFIFLGDTGQGDVKVAEELLANASVSFCAIHIVTPAPPGVSKRPSIAESQVVEDVCREYLERPQAIRLRNLFPGRIFFYGTVADLAVQLEHAKWLSTESAGTIRECYYRDLCEEAHDCAKYLNLRSLDYIVNTRVGPSLDLWEIKQATKARHFADQLRLIRENTDPIFVSAQSAATAYVDIVRLVSTVSSSSGSTAQSQKKKTLMGRVHHLKRRIVQSRTYCTCTLMCGSRTVYDLGRTDNAVLDARGLVHWTQKLAVPRDRLLESDHLAFTIHTDVLYADWTTTRVGIVAVPVIYEEDVSRCVNDVEKELRCKMYLPDAENIGDAVGTLRVTVTFSE